MIRDFGRLFTCLLVVALTISMLPAANAEQTNGIPISSVEELIALDGQRDSYYLTTDLDLSGTNWTPIEFFGMLDGQGHTISGLSITATTENQNRYGLFSTIMSISDLEYERVAVKNLNLTDVHIDLTLPGGCEYWVGGLCGYAYQATIENIHSTGSVQVRSINNEDSHDVSVAGICGEASNWYVRFFDCVNE